MLAIGMALIGWVNLVNGGLSPQVTKTISDGEPLKTIQKLIGLSRTIIFYVIILYFGFSGLLLYFSDFIYQESIFFEFISLIVLTLAILYFTIGDSVRQGLFQQHVNNLVLAFF